MKTFNIFSAGEMQHIDPRVDHLIISINEPDLDARDIQENANCKGVLRLFFDDLEPKYNNLGRMSLGREPQYMTAEQAREILQFVSNNENVDKIIVHCTAGMCRSPGVAAAISYIWNGRGSEQVFFDKYTPNRHVYRTLLETGFEDGYFSI